MTALWDWSVIVYNRPGAAPACLHLQDHHGASVPLLMAAAWAAVEGRAFDPVAAVRLTHDWEYDVVGLLRAVRRGLKFARDGVDDTPREALRQNVKAVELEAERVLLDALEALAGPPGKLGRPESDPADAIAAVAVAWARAGEFSPPPGEEVKNLASLLC